MRELIYNALFKTKEVELSKMEVELAIGDESKKLLSDLEKSANETNKELDNAFTPIRQLEQALERLQDQIPSKIETFTSFKKKLMDLELQYDKDINKIRNAENDLGIKIKRPEILDKVVKVLEKYQREEELFRQEINEFNKLSKKFKNL